MEIKSRGKKKELVTAVKSSTNQTKEKYEDIHSRFMINSDRFLQIAIAIRLASVVLTQSFFVPDEYWQSLEVSHLKVFGYGHETWEWKEGIRASLYPLFFSVLYKIVQILHMDFASVIIYTPRILQAMLSGFADINLFRFSTRLFGTTVGFYSYLLFISSWFIFYTGSRTLSNSTEMALILISLGSHDWQIFSVNASEYEKTSSLALGLTLCILSCIVRPSAVITWLPILLYELYYDTLQKNSHYFLKCCVSIGLALLFVSTMLDYLFYGRFIIVHWRFFQFNVLNNLSGFYGGHPWHWYITQGIPLVMFTHLPLMLLGIAAWKQNTRAKIALLLIISLQVISLSLVEHKEFRFLLPSAPLLVCLSAIGFCHLIYGCIPINHIQAEQKTPDIKSSIYSITQKGFYCMAFIIVLNSLVALYTGLVHQRGVIDTMTYLRKDLAGDRGTDSVLFLMPCHSTPYYSHIHRNVTMRFLSCEPNFQDGYIEEADLFYSNSTKWLQAQFSHQIKSIPSHIIAYNILLEDPGVASLLNERGYVEAARFFHTHFPEGRVGSHVVVLSPSERSQKTN